MIYEYVYIFVARQEINGPDALWLYLYIKVSAQDTTTYDNILFLIDQSSNRVLQ